MSDEDAKKGFPKGFVAKKPYCGSRRSRTSSTGPSPVSLTPVGEQADELAQHDGGGAPNLVAETDSGTDIRPRRLCAAWCACRMR